MDPSPVALAPPPGVPVPSLVLLGGDLVDTLSLRQVSRRAPALKIGGGIEPKAEGPTLLYR
jgi:hypothetical protein